MQNVNKLGEQICSTFKVLVQDRAGLEQYWRDAYEYTDPKRGKGFLNLGSGSAQAYQSKILDSTSIESTTLLAASTLTGLTPNNSQWCTLQNDAEESSQMNVWYEKASKKMFTHIHTVSNYDAIAMEYFTDIAIAGMAGMYCEWDSEAQSLYFEEWPLDSLYVQSSISKEMIDTVYRKFKYTAKEAAHKFGTNALPDVMKTVLKDNPESTKLHEFIHAIRPRLKKSGKQSNGKFKSNMPFESVFVHAASKTVVQEGGHKYFPVIIPRFDLIPYTDYAVGQVNKALPDIRMLNKILELSIQAKEIDLYPPLLAKDDGVINVNTIRLGARRVIPVADTNNIKPMPTGANHSLSYQEIDRLQNQIKRVMMSDMLQPLQKQNMTATEVATRTQLVRQLLGPVYSRLQSEFLSPLIYLVFNLLYEAGEFPELPINTPELNFKPLYQSPQARAQRMSEVEAMSMFEESITLAAQADPTVLDNYDMDKATKKKAEILGVPADLIKSPKEVKNLRDQRAEQQQAQMQMAMEQGQ